MIKRSIPIIEEDEGVIWNLKIHFFIFQEDKSSKRNNFFMYHRLHVRYVHAQLTNYNTRFFFK